MTYEFTDSEAQKLKVFGNKLAIFGILLMTIAIAATLQEVFTKDQPLSIMYLDILSYVPLLLSGFLLFRPSNNLRNIANTEGRDIKELMTALKEFNLAFLIAALLITLLVVGLFLSFLTKMGRVA